MTDKRKTMPPAARDRTYWLSMARRFALAALAVISVYVAFVAVAPFLISSSMVRAAMEEAVAEWTGHNAAIGDDPEIQFWPEPRITLSKVTLTKREPGRGKLLARVEKLSATFGFYDALRGEPVFHDFRFLRPEIFLTRGDDGTLDWSSQGSLGAAVRSAEPRDRDGQVLAKELDARIGTITVEEGTVSIRDKRSGRLLTLGGLNADVAWPKLSEELKAYLIVRIAGVDVRLDLSTNQPLLLFAGKSARMSSSFRSEALTGRFNGIANISGGYFLSGSLNINASNIPALASWAGVELPAAKLLKQGSLQAELTTVGGNLRFGDLRFTLNDVTANGIVEVARAAGENLPKLSGTLAFDTLDIGALLGAFSLHLPSFEASGDRDGSELIALMDFDLSLSAGQAALSPFVLQDVAASFITRAGRAKLDIADSVFEGGRLTGHLDGISEGFEDGGNLRVSAKNVDLQGVAKRLSLPGPMPRARGSLELTLNSRLPFWATAAGDIEGSFKLHADAGRLPTASLAEISAQAQRRAYFRLTDAGSGGIAFNRIDIAAKFADGAAEFEQAELETDDQIVALAGLIPYASNSLALSGRLQPREVPDGTPVEALRFFIGGSWPDPILSPILPPPKKM